MKISLARPVFVFLDRRLNFDFQGSRLSLRVWSLTLSLYDHFVDRCQGTDTISQFLNGIHLFQLIYDGYQIMLVGGWSINLLINGARGLALRIHFKI